MIKVNCEKAYKCLQKLVLTDATYETLHWYCVMINMAIDGTKKQFEIAKQELLAWYIGQEELYIPCEIKHPDCKYEDGQIKFAIEIADDYPEEIHDRYEYPNH